MGRRSGNRSSPNLDLMLNLSPPSHTYYAQQTIAGSISSSEISAIAAVGSLCISSPESYASSSSSCATQVAVEGEHSEAAGMVLVGCQTCLMYFMLSELDLKCPKCKSDTLLCFHNQTRKNSNLLSNQDGRSYDHIKYQISS